MEDYNEDWESQVREDWEGWEIYEFAEEITAPDNAEKLAVRLKVKRSVVCLDDIQLRGDKVETAIGDILEPAIKVYKEGDNLKVHTMVGETITVYNVMGRKLTQVKSTSNIVTIPGLPQKQMLLINNGKQTAKIVL